MTFFLCSWAFHITHYLLLATHSPLKTPMLIDEIFALENANESGIHLIRDRKFFQAYERSAHRFVKFLREYQVHGKFVKKISDSVVYLGFPDSVVESLKAEAENLGYTWNVVAEDSHFEISGLPPLENFAEWKSGVLQAGANSPLNAGTAKPPNPAQGELFRNAPPQTPKISEGRLMLAYKEMYDFTLYLCRLTGKFYRNYRFGLGDRLREQSVCLLEHLQLVLHRAAAFDSVLGLSILLRIRIETRLLLDLKQITRKQWIFINENVEKIKEHLSLGFRGLRTAGESESESSGSLSNACASSV
ncbi:hypothetical protein [uncultured Fibrobacter sp.]|uniref:hypothetical protein n=1 Tax=uncultured Fibrobacter sp. TaxID=261512 RepID=UPI002803ADFB|nr:hypothetical protein [uncultured Fibrobacter sp.]